MISSAARPAAEPNVAPSGPTTFDDLASLTSDQLAACFARGACVSLDAIAGDPAGRVLAVTGLEAPPFAALRRRIARTPLILWEGKSFRSEAGATRGFGSNRVRLGRSFTLFRFTTAEGPSIVDGAPCLQIDYSVLSNPRLVRRTYDELREVAPSLYLGRGGIRGRGRTRLVLWFAVDATQQARTVSIDPPSPYR